jgi:hypothetical protein
MIGQSRKLFLQIWVVLGLFVTLTGVSSAQENRAWADIGRRNGKTVMFAAYNLSGDPTGCVVRKFDGTIIKVHYDEEFAMRIDGFTLSSKGRTYFNLEESVYDEFKLPRSDIGWLPTLIAVNKKVHVDAHLCGASGGFAIAQNIIAYQPSRKRDTTRSRKD